MAEGENKGGFVELARQISEKKRRENYLQSVKEVLTFLDALAEKVDLKKPRHSHRIVRERVYLAIWEVAFKGPWPPAEKPEETEDWTPALSGDPENPSDEVIYQFYTKILGYTDEELQKLFKTK